MTESVSEEKIVISTTTTPSSEKIAERSIIVYETRIEPNVIETIGEQTKTQLFTRFGFMKPKPEEIQLLSIDKYYEPYMAISGRYMIDYYRKCVYTVKVDNKVHEVILSNQKYKPSQPTDNPTKDHNVIKLQGEERLTTEAKASLILDKFGQEIKPKELPSTPPEPNPKEILTTYRVKEITQDTDLDTIRSRILKRPKDINRLNNELFEINERAIIYTPRYRALYTNLKTGETKAIEYDGITAQKIQHPRPHPQHL
ncbi:hypothetical protein HXY33_09030 [Candidatus Bathyarchaeota archaeon]|nr:hypothetical protein [Candidatus Bathyarchaeota archaeon]